MPSATKSYCPSCKTELDGVRFGCWRCEELEREAAAELIKRENEVRLEAARVRVSGDDCIRRWVPAPNSPVSKQMLDAVREFRARTAEQRHQERRDQARLLALVDGVDGSRRAALLDWLTAARRGWNG